MVMITQSEKLRSNLIDRVHYLLSEDLLSSAHQRNASVMLVYICVQSCVTEIALI